MNTNYVHNFRRKLWRNLGGQGGSKNFPDRKKSPDINLISGLN
ncbi:hypothetical protein ASZ90_017625 [hydrocarbon metagenome]|uniref:Uncharacterized protein n=1 Tax=hydrocarbon metagenome TaxID=938273 RepID=A0A0W8E8I3_9ZZZZ